jgi:hypothetical protein
MTLLHAVKFKPKRQIDELINDKLEYMRTGAASLERNENNFCLGRVPDLV